MNDPVVNSPSAIVTFRTLRSNVIVKSIPAVAVELAVPVPALPRYQSSRFPSTTPMFLVEKPLAAAGGADVALALLANEVANWTFTGVPPPVNGTFANAHVVRFPPAASPRV